MSPNIPKNPTYVYAPRLVLIPTVQLFLLVETRATGCNLSAVVNFCAFMETMSRPWAFCTTDVVWVFNPREIYFVCQLFTRDVGDCGGGGGVHFCLTLTAALLPSSLLSASLLPPPPSPLLYVCFFIFSLVPFSSVRLFVWVDAVLFCALSVPSLPFPSAFGMVVAVVGMMTMMMAMALLLLLLLLL